MSPVVVVNRLISKFQVLSEILRGPDVYPEEDLVRRGQQTDTCLYVYVVKIHF